VFLTKRTVSADHRGRLIPVTGRARDPWLTYAPHTDRVQLGAPPRRAPVIRATPGKASGRPWLGPRVGADGSQWLAERVWEDDGGLPLREPYTWDAAHAAATPDL
jgi:hypothetical protein